MLSKQILIRIYMRCSHETCTDRTYPYVQSATVTLEWIICLITVVKGILKMYYTVSMTLLLKKVQD